MKLKRCYIENFGTLHDFSYEFEEGLNTVCRDNGWGKTTFAVFIKAMFYGMEYAPRKKTAENERKKYFPWQGGNFGGSIEFTVGEKEYRLQRYFGKKDKEDVFALYDRKTGLPSADYTENIGEEIFRIDAASYARSTYIPQNAITVSMTDSINAKLSNLLENGNDINNFEKAYAKLEERLREYKKTGGRGKIALLKEKISAKEEEIEECKNKYNGMRLYEEQIAEQKEQKRALEASRESVREAIVKAGNMKELTAKLESYRILKDQEAEITEKKKKYDMIFSGGLPGDERIRAMEDEQRALDGLLKEREAACLSGEERERLEELRLFFAKGCPENPQIEMYLGESRAAEDIRNEKIRITASLSTLRAHREQERARAEQERERKNEQLQAAVNASKEKALLFQKVLLSLGILVLAGGVALFFLNKIAGIAGCALAVFLIVAAATRKPKLSVGETEPEEKRGEDGAVISQEVSELEGQLEKVDEEYQKMLEHYEAFVGQFELSDASESPVQTLLEIKAKAEEYRALLERESERGEEREALEERAGALKASLKEFFASVNEKYLLSEDFRVACEALTEDRKEYLRLTAELEESREKTLAFKKSNPDLNLNEKGEKPSGEWDLEELQRQEKQWEEKIEAVNRKINSYRKDRDAMSVVADKQPDMEEEFEGLKEELAQAEYRARILEYTMQYLKEAKESFSTHYMGTMHRGFHKYASMISGALGERIQLDVQLNAQVEAGASLRGSEYFSVGNRDFVGICIRLALVEALFEEEKPFVILDDPFVNLDDTRVDNVKRLLHRLGEEYQVLYLVCHSSRAE